MSTKNEDQSLFGRMFADIVATGKVGMRLAEADIESKALLSAVRKAGGERYAKLFDNDLMKLLEPLLVTQALKAGTLALGDKVPEAIAEGLVNRCDRVAVLFTSDQLRKYGEALLPFITSIAVESGAVAVSTKPSK